MYLNQRKTPPQSPLPEFGEYESQHPYEGILVPRLMDTSTWHSYAHLDEHYSLQYPPEYKIEDHFYPSISLFKTDTSGRTPDPGMREIYIHSAPEWSSCSTDADAFNILTKVYEGAKNAGSQSEFETVYSIHGRDTIKGIGQWNTDLLADGTKSVSMLTHTFPKCRNGVYFNIQFVMSGYPTKEEAASNRELIDSIMWTFKFE